MDMEETIREGGGGGGGDQGAVEAKERKDTTGLKYTYHLFQPWNG